MLKFVRQRKPKPTQTEEYVWKILRKSRTGYFWRRQAPLIGYYADFYCPKLKVIIEIDGGSHIGHEAYDAERDLKMRQVLGLRTVRISNQRAWEFTTSTMIAWIKAVCVQ